MKTIKGTSVNIGSNILVRITRKASIFNNSNQIILAEQVPKSGVIKHNYISIDNTFDQKNSMHSVFYIGKTDFLTLKEGDIVKITPEGQCFVLWEETEDDNLIFTTDFCNSSCIMCPQVPQGTPYSYFQQNMKMLALIKDKKNLKTIGISGGEPTIFKDEILQILNMCSKKFSNVPLSMLTNGKNFDDFEFAKQCVLANKNLTFCIPLYATYSDKHDYIVGCKGSFIRTINGIYNLIRLRQHIEIRVVVLRENYKDLPGIIDFIYQNMPFVAHVAIMGMEITGMAHDNCDKVWIDPVDYQEQLKEAIIKLKRYDLPFSIYNIQRCLLKKELWGYDCDSISAWKKKYLIVCENCKEKENCCGVFMTSSKQSSNIKAIV